jgi:hypothetical protein
MFKINRMIKAVTLLVALGLVMMVWAHGRSAPQPTNSVKAVQLKITFGQHWANVTAVEGGTFTIEREGKKLAITPYIRDAGKVELQVESVGTLLVGKGLTKLKSGGLELGVQVLDANKKFSSDVVAAAGLTCCAKACDGTMVCGGVCVCTDCGRCGPNWCDCAIPGPPDE